MTIAIPETSTPPPAVLSDIDISTLRFHTMNARSEATNKAYARQWKGFVAWCHESGFTPFPAAAPVVILFLDSLVQKGLRGSTIDQTLAAIKAVHSDNDHHPGVHDAVFALNSTRTTNAVASLHRVIGAKGGNRVKKPRAFTQGEVMSMVVTSPVSAQGVQDIALLLLGVNAGMRGSEYVALTVSDVSFDDAGMEVFIARSKTDQEAVGETIYVGRLPEHLRHLDPVRAMKRHIAKNRSGAKPEDPLFIAYRKGGALPHYLHGEIHGMTREAVSACIIRCAKRAQLPRMDKTISSHSLRHTFITQSFKQGVPQADIARTSRHKNMTVLAGYDQQSARDAVVSPRLWS